MWNHRLPYIQKIRNVLYNYIPIKNIIYEIKCPPQKEFLILALPVSISLKMMSF